MFFWLPQIRAAKLLALSSWMINTTAIKCDKLNFDWNFLPAFLQFLGTQHSCVAHPTQNSTNSNSWESTFVEFCVDGINLFDENTFIDSLGPGRDSNPDPSALNLSECTTTPSTSSFQTLSKKLMFFGPKDPPLKIKPSIWRESARTKSRAQLDNSINHSHCPSWP
jgi:hypothetical protein